MTQNLNRQSFRNIFPPFLKNMYEISLQIKLDLFLWKY